MGFIDQEDPASRFSFANAFSDGPNGVRGEDWINGAPSAAIPCATALGASFGIDLTAQLARLLAEECGRNFESFSEDPMLSGVIASAFTQGLQGQGISASPKHFLANEAENGRRWRDSVISERAMREIYLEPFRIVVELGNPWCIMTAWYNSVNGSFCSESEDLLSILRNEWCYAGVVISDWFGTYSTAAAFTAGLDIEMLGPTKFRSQGAILEALKQGDITNHQITNSTARVLDLLRKTGRVGTPGAAPLPKAEEPHYLDDPKSRNLLRHAAEASIVLLKNEKGTLPLVERHSRLTVFGRHAKEPALFGGGSASLKVPYTSTPWEAIQRSFLGASYGSGVAIERLVPLPNESRLKLGEITLDWYNGDQPSTDNRFFSQTLKDTLYMLVEHAPDGLVDRSNFCTSMTFDFTARNTGFYDLSLCGPGNAKCTVDENVVLEVQRDLKVSTEDFLFDRSKLDVVRARPLPCTTTLSTTPPFRQAKKKIYY
ncbi:hypothetical protein LRP88_12655 [Fusarium phalaenopsidis]